MNPAIWKSALWTTAIFTLSWMTVAGAATYQEMNYPEDVAVPPIFTMEFEPLPGDQTLPSELPEEPVEAPEAPTWDGNPHEDLQGPEDAVQFDTGDGIVTTGPAEVAKLREVESRGETEDEYHYRLCADLQNMKPWVDWGCVKP